MIKITFLVRDESAALSALKEVSRDEWHAIISKNKTLPTSEQRYFISDIIAEDGDVDIMIIETDCKSYKKWHVYNNARCKLLKSKEGKKFFSLDAEPGTLECAVVTSALSDGIEIEESIHNAVANEALRKALVFQKPWAMDLFESYQLGEKRACTKQIAEKYGVCDFTVRRWKKEFEKYCKNFFEK